MKYIYVRLNSLTRKVKFRQDLNWDHMLPPPPDGIKNNDNNKLSTLVILN